MTTAPGSAPGPGVRTLAGGAPPGPPATVGILGGTFDPIHLAHLIIAEEAWAQLGLREVVFVPAGDPYHRAHQPGAAAADRLAMVRLAVADNPHFRVSTVDIDREGPSYSVDTVADLQREYGPDERLAFLTGWDSLAEIHRWRTPNELARRCQLVAVRRPGVRDPDWTALEQAIPGARERILALDAPLLDISASAIRARIARGLPVRYRTPDAVIGYIRERGLYRRERAGDEEARRQPAQGDHDA